MTPELWQEAPSSTGFLYQFGSGFLQGMTTLPVGQSPQTEGEGIARTLGVVAGFAGLLVPGKLARVVGAKRLARTLERVPSVPVGGDLQCHRRWHCYRCPFCSCFPSADPSK